MTLILKALSGHSHAASLAGKIAFFPNLYSILFLSFISISTSQAQPSNELRFLIFEPVLISTSVTDDSAQITELTTLPNSGKALSTSEILINRLLEPSQQINSGLNLEQSIVDYENSIHELELLGGAYEATLAQELLSLGQLYQSAGDHIKAIEYFNQAIHINRVNLGLFNLEQETILLEKIRSHVALGELYEADQQQQYLFYLKTKNFDMASVDIIPALNYFAEWNLFAFDSNLQIGPGQHYASQANGFSGQIANSASGMEDFKSARLLYAQGTYTKIIEIILSNSGISDPLLLDIEKKLALTNYFFATNLNLSKNAFSNGNNAALNFSPSQGFNDMSRISTNSLGARHGREALERRLEYLYKTDGITPQEIAKARIELADWLLLFKKRTQALNMYQAAYDEIFVSGIDQQIIDDLFSPVLPRTIPAFLNYRYTRAAHNISADQPLTYKGWLDVHIKINRFGRIQDADVLNKSAETADIIEDRLIRFLRNSTSFRPRILNGQLLAEDTLDLRYYYSY